MGTSFSTTDYAFNGNVSLPANAALGIFSAQSYSTTYGTGGDDTAAIQAAINAAISAGGAVAFLPPPVSGYLNFSATLNLGNNGACLVGASPGVKLRIVAGSNLDWAISTGVASAVDYRTVFAVNSRVINLSGTNYNFYDITRPVGLSSGGGVYNVTFVGDSTQTVGLGLGVMLNAAQNFVLSNTQYTGFIGEDISLWDCYNTTVSSTTIGSAGPSVGVHRACYDTSIVTATTLGATASPYRVYAEQFTVASVTTTYSPIYTKFVDCHAYCATLQPEAYDISGAAFVNLTGSTGDNVTTTINGSTRFGVPSIDILSDVGALSGVSSVTAGTGIAVTGTGANPVIGLAVPVPTADGGTGLTTVGSNGQVLTSNGTTLSYQTPAATGVTSVNAAAPITTTGGTTPTIGFTAPGAAGNLLTSTGSAWASAAPSAATSYPFAVVQEGLSDSGVASTATVTFSKTATSGNTLLLLVAGDYRDTYTAPTGWTQVVTAGSGNYSRLAAYLKTSAGTETSAVLGTSGSVGPALCYFIEIAGTHSLDVSATLTPSATQNLTFPNLTPSSGAMVFCLASLTTNSGNPSPSPLIFTSINWRPFGFSAQTARIGVMGLYLGVGAGASIPGPQTAYSAGVFTSGDTPALATFSIK